MILRRYIFLSSLAVGALLVLAAPSVAQHSQPQPQRVGLYLTPVMHSNQRLTRTRTLYLPQPAAAAITNKPSGSGTGGGNGKSGGGGTGGSGSTTCPTTSTSTYSVGCPVAPTTTVPEAEEEIAADPGDSSGKTYVAAISDFSLRGGYNTTKWAITTNGGSTWSQHFVPLSSQNDPITSNDMGIVWGANSDPDVAIDGSGNVFLSDLYMSSGYTKQYVVPNGLYVSSDTITNLSSTSSNTTNYFTNTQPVMVNTGSTTACDPAGPNPFNYYGFCFEDKPWVAVDNSTTDNTQGVAYVVWAHWWSCYYLGFGAIGCDAGPDIYLAYSTDHGQSWKVWSQEEVVNNQTVSVPIPIDQGTIPTGQSQSGNVEGAQVAVGPNGTVYIAYEAFDPDPSTNTRWQYLTWSKPTVTGSGTSETLSFNFSTPSNVTPTAGFQDLSFKSNYRVNSFPALAIGGSGKVDLEYADQVSKNSEIEFVTCSTTTTTANCTTPLAFNGSHSKGQEFFPAIAVAPTSGVINTSWFDTRNSGNNTADFDVYAAFDSGSGFSSAARVTPTSINTGVTNFIGDYSGIAAVYGGTILSVAHPVWNDFSETCGLVTCQLSGTMQTSKLTTP